MAEFQEVAEQKQRMCKMYENNACNGCPLSNGDCGVLNVRYTDANDVQRVENVVMAWAAEHPVVYPTWADYITMKMLEDITNRNDTTPQTLGTWMGKTNIPADIAQKLGIEPKEGK